MPKFYLKPSKIYLDFIRKIKFYLLENEKKKYLSLKILVALSHLKNSEINFLLFYFSKNFSGKFYFFYHKIVLSSLHFGGQKNENKTWCKIIAIYPPRQIKPHFYDTFSNVIFLGRGTENFTNAFFFLSREK